MKLLTRQEELVLVAVLNLGGSAPLLEVRKYLTGSTGKDWSISSIYVPLDRMEKAGLLSTSVGAPESRRGGKGVKIYKITKDGLQALKELKSIHDTLWDGLDEMAFE